MTLAKRRNVVNKLLTCFYEMFYSNFLSLNVLRNRGEKIEGATGIEPVACRSAVGECSTELYPSSSLRPGSKAFTGENNLLVIFLSSSFKFHG